MYTLTFRPDDGGPDVHIEPANGRAFDVEPLNHQALYGYTTAEACFPMTLKNAVINGPAWEGGSTHTITAKISAEAENPMYGLVVGGWLPFPFASSGFAMVDRNVVSRIQKLRDAQLRDPLMNSDPHLDLLFAATKISPIPCVLEGGYRRVQSRDEVDASLASAYTTLKKVLPLESLHYIGPPNIQGIYGLVDDLKQSQDKAVPFLQRICPWISEPVSPARKLKVVTDVLEAARECRIRPSPCANMTCCTSL